MKNAKSKTYSIPINQWPESDRPREKLIKYGAFKLTDSELLAIILRTGSGKQSALGLARQLLQKCGGLEKLAMMSNAEILDLKISGIGKAKATTISAAIHFARRLHSEVSKNKNLKITQSIQIAEIYGPVIQSLKKEVFMVILLDTGLKIIKDIIVSEGTINSTSITPREIFHEAVKSLAANVIILHNHPSGSNTPSKNDKEFTKKVVISGKLLSIPVLDHIIIGGGKFYSFTDNGLI